MAITAKFQADFSSFIDAIDKAEIALVDMSKGASKVEASLNKMVDSFSGRKLIQEASLMTIAVEKAGGVAKLTSKELEIVGAKANDAADKLKRLGYEVPAGLQKLADATRDVGDAGAGWTKWLGNANNILSLFGVGLSVGAVISFGKALLDDADALQKMHDKTGISIEGLQRFQAAGDDAGNSLDEITSAIVQMENRLAGGDKSAIGALEKLGLHLSDLKHLSPEKQFIAISDAIREIDDPAQQVNIAMDLFGKQGATVLPTLKRGFDDLRDSVVGMSTDTVQALDNLGDSLGKASRSIKGDIANAINFLFLGFSNADRAAERFAKQLKDVKPPTDQLTVSIKDLTVSQQTQRDIERDLTESAKASIAATHEREAATKKLSGELEKHTEAVHKVEAGFFGLNAVVGQSDTSVVEFAKSVQKVQIELDKVEQTAHIANFGFKGMADGLEKVGEKVRDIGPDIEHQFVGPLLEGAKAANKFQISFDGLIKGITGGNGLKGVFENIGGGFIDQIGRMISGGLTSLIGSAIKGLGGLIGKIFGGDKEAKQVREMRDQFIAAAGGLAELQKQADLAGVSLSTMLSTKKVDAFNTAVKQINEALQFQEDALQLAKDTAEKYGITLEEMGPKFRQGQLNEQLLQLYQDQQVLTAAGVDFDLVLQKQAASFQDLIAVALKTGATIPEQLKPTIQRMIELGLLTDLSGEKLTDISQLTFAETLDKKFQTLIDTINKLADAISRGLGGAINQIPKDVTIGVHYAVDDLPQPQQFHAGGVIPFVPKAHTGLAVDEALILAQKGEGIVSRRGMQTLGVSGLNALNGGAMPSNGGKVLDFDSLKSEIQAVRLDAARRDIDLPYRLARSMRDEMQKMRR